MRVKVYSLRRFGVFSLITGLLESFRSLRADQRRELLRRRHLDHLRKPPLEGEPVGLMAF